MKARTIKGVETITFPKNLLYGPKLVYPDGRVQKCLQSDRYDLPFGCAIIVLANEPLPPTELSEGSKDPVPFVYIGTYFASLKAMRKVTNLAGRVAKKYSTSRFTVHEKPAPHDLDSGIVHNTDSISLVYHDYKRHYERGDMMTTLIS